MPFIYEAVSVLICRKDTTLFHEINFLMQIAWSFAEKGYLVFFLSGKVIDSDSNIDFTPYLNKPEVMQRIIFRYFTESSEILNWCHEMHKRSRLPHIVIFSGLQTFGQTNEFTVVEICAALLDAMQYCSGCIKKSTYLLVSVCDNKNDQCPSHLVPFFKKIVFLENVESNSHRFIQLYPVLPADQVSKIEITNNFSSIVK